MRRAKILKSTWIVVAVFASITGAAAHCAAYSNCNPASIMEGGPHRLINDLAVRRFVAVLPEGDPRRDYAAAAGYDLLGPSFVDRAEWVEAPPEQEQLFDWKQWVVEGGFTADEPELFNSFRHFYDPTSRNPDPPLRDLELQSFDQKTVIRGVPYLTDHLKQIELYLGSWGVLTPNPAVWYANVKVNAKSWATTGEPSDGGTANEYSWEKGRACFKEAFSGKDHNGKPLGKGRRDKLYAMAWRSVGETMHLLADMSCIPHVRNDSHPGVSLAAMIREKTVGLSPEDQKKPDYSANLGILKNDPYELYCQDDMIQRCVPDPAKLEVVPEAAIKTLRNAKDPGGLFDLVAGFTNRSFVSADTIPFIPDSNKYRAMLQPNGCLAYRKPWIFHLGSGISSERSPEHKYDTFSTKEIEWIAGLDALEVDRLVVTPDDAGGYCKAKVWGRDVRLCHRSWMSFAGWAEPADHYLVSSPCVEDQASILVPLAVASNACLLDLFMPKLEVIVQKIDYQNGTLHAEVKHTPHGAFSEPLVYNDANPQCILHIDGRAVPINKSEVSVRDGKVSILVRGDAVRLSDKADQKVALEMQIAGLNIRSAPFDANPRLDRLAMLRKLTRMSLYVSPGFCDIDESVTYRDKTETKQINNQPWGANLRDTVRWDGASFQATGKQHEGKGTVTVSGTVDPNVERIETLNVSFVYDEMEPKKRMNEKREWVTISEGGKTKFSFSASRVPVGQIVTYPDRPDFQTVNFGVSDHKTATVAPDFRLEQSVSYGSRRGEPIRTEKRFLATKWINSSIHIQFTAPPATVSKEN